MNESMRTKSPENGNRLNFLSMFFLNRILAGSLRLRQRQPRTAVIYLWECTRAYANMLTFLKSFKYSFETFLCDASTLAHIGRPLLRSERNAELNDSIEGKRHFGGEMQRTQIGRKTDALTKCGIS